MTAEEELHRLLSKRSNEAKVNVALEVLRLVVVIDEEAGELKRLLKKWRKQL